MAKSKATRRNDNTSTKPPSSIPEPFKTAPTSLAPIYDNLSKDSVYLFHIDRHPSWFKKRIFIIPTLLNFGILMGLLWRAYSVLPWYWSLLVSFTQGPKALGVTWNRAMVLSILRRVVTFAIDYVLVSIVWKWPLLFFLELPVSPIGWRWKLGFRDSEVVVRVSRNWGRDDLMAGTKKGAESPFFKTRVLPALSTEKMSKTGYLLMDGSWDLDFALMVYATQLLEKKDLKELQVDRKIFAWFGDENDGQWTIWDEKTFGEETGDHVEELGAQSKGEHREKIFQIQEKLKEMGKEDLFFKWVELIQFESTQPGGFNQERQIQAGIKVQALFEQFGVDYQDFERSIGGLQ